MQMNVRATGEVKLGEVDAVGYGKLITDTGEAGGAFILIGVRVALEVIVIGEMGGWKVAQSIKPGDTKITRPKSKLDRLGGSYEDASARCVVCSNVASGSSKTLNVVLLS